MAVCINPGYGRFTSKPICRQSLRAQIDNKRHIKTALEERGFPFDEDHWDFKKTDVVCRVFGGERFGNGAGCKGPRGEAVPFYVEKMIRLLVVTYVQDHYRHKDWEYDDEARRNGKAFLKCIPLNKCFQKGAEAIEEYLEMMAKKDSMTAVVV